MRYAGCWSWRWSPFPSCDVPGLISVSLALCSVAGSRRHSWQSWLISFSTLTPVLWVLSGESSLPSSNGKVAWMWNVPALEAWRASHLESSQCPGDTELVSEWRVLCHHLSDLLSCSHFFTDFHFTGPFSFLPARQPSVPQLMVLCHFAVGCQALHLWIRVI
jgi:hypothetical protein